MATSLRRIVRSILRTGTPAFSLLLAGCGGGTNDVGSADGGGGGGPEWSGLAACKTRSRYDLYSTLTVGPGTDGVEFESGAPRKRGKLGSPCAKAKDPAACRAKIEEVMNALPPNAPEVFAFVRGDEIESASRFQLGAVVAPIDSLDEAATIYALSVGGENVKCDFRTVREDPDGWVFGTSLEANSCGEVIEYYYKVKRSDASVAEAGSKVIQERREGCAVAGRRPSRPSFSRSEEPWRASLAACFNEMARLEGAAVLAFAELERDCAALDAPPTLLERMRRARADEIAHTEMTTALAARFGGARSSDSLVSVPLARVADGRPLLLRLAIENAIEGCVREGYGALVAAFQAAHARDGAVRAAFARIAAEELEHAELSLDLARWLDSRLDAPGRAEVARAKELAFLALEGECAVEPAPAVAHDAGMPTAAEARELLCALRGSACLAAA